MLISISIPVFNEEENIDRLFTRLREVTDKLSDYEWEFVVTDNASTDKTFAKLRRLAKDDPRIRIIRFSRNFGFQKSILANYGATRGDAVIQIDADLQDPPELFDDFLRIWREGYKVVYGLRSKRQEGFIINTIRKLGYSAIDRLSDIPVPRGAGDFRLLDREVIQALLALNDQAPYIRGMVAFLGYESKAVSYERDARLAGKSKFGLMKLISLGIDGICSQSTKLLRLITVFGVILSISVGVLALYYFAAYFFKSSAGASGFTTLALIALSSLAVNALFLGIIGEYIGRIFANTRSLPLVVYDNGEYVTCEHPDELIEEKTS